MEAGSQHRSLKRRVNVSPEGQARKVQRALAMTAIEGVSSNVALSQGKQSAERGASSDPGGRKMSGQQYGSKSFSLGSGNCAHDTDFADDVLEPEVPGVVTVVKISCMDILREICNKLNVNIDCQDVFKFGDGTFYGWIHVQIPALVDPGKTQEMFIGDEKTDRNEALEAAAKVAINFFVKHCRLVIDDANYEKLRVAEREAFRAEFFSSMYYDMLAGRDKRDELMKQKLESVLTALKDICVDFKESLPIVVTKEGSDDDGALKETISYSGDAGLEKPIEKFAYKFVKAEGFGIVNSFPKAD